MKPRNGRRILLLLLAPSESLFQDKANHLYRVDALLIQISATQLGVRS